MISGRTANFSFPPACSAAGLFTRSFDPVAAGVNGGVDMSGFLAGPIFGDTRDEERVAWRLVSREPSFEDSSLEAVCRVRQISHLPQWRTISRARKPGIEEEVGGFARQDGMMRRKQVWRARNKRRRRRPFLQTYPRRGKGERLICEVVHPALLERTCRSSERLGKRAQLLRSDLGGLFQRLPIFGPVVGRGRGFRGGGFGSVELFNRRVESHSRRRLRVTVTVTVGWLQLRVSRGCRV